MAVIAANAVAADVPVAGARAVAVVDAQAAADGVAIVDDAADDNSGCVKSVGRVAIPFLFCP